MGSLLKTTVNLFNGYYKKAGLQYELNSELHTVNEAEQSFM